MKVELIGDQRLKSVGDDVQLGVRLTLYLTSENDGEHETVTRLARQLKKDSEEKMIELINEWR